MADSVADDLWVDAVVEGQRGVRVAHVVQADSRHAGPVDQPVEPAGDRVRVEELPVREAHQLAVVLVACTERLPFLVQHGDVAAEVGDRQWIEGDRSPAALRLAIGVLGLAVHHDARVGQFERRLVEVE